MSKAHLTSARCSVSSAEYHTSLISPRPPIHCFGFNLPYPRDGPLICGIISCVTRGDETLDTLVHGLSKLKYRRYASAGVALANSHIDMCKHSGKIDDLREALDERTLSGPVGIGHTR